MSSAPRLANIDPRVVQEFGVVNDAVERRAPPNWGHPLNDDDYASLESSWISRDIADAAFLRRVDAAEGREVVGQKGRRDCGGLLIPNYWPGEARPHSYRIRRDNPEWTEDKEGKLKPKGKYLGAPGSANRLYFPPDVTPDQLGVGTIPIVIVEGEKKALALQRLADHATGHRRFIVIAIAGVWNWRGKVGKANGPQGERVDVSGPISDLARITWADRNVTILFDANIHINDNVKWARKGIARELATRGARVDFVNLPEDCGVNGVDDLLGLWGPERVLQLLENPAPAASLQIVQPPQFQSRPQGMFRVSSRGQNLFEYQLTNYQASIARSLCLDDGVETSREFELQCELFGRPFRFSIAASTFAAMKWPIEQLGPGAITFANQMENARIAIQSSSLMADERCVFTHTGWRNIDGHWHFLHGGGVIGEDGTVAGFDVRLTGALGRYELCPPSTPDLLVKAVRSSLKLLDLCPPSIGFPLLGAIFRAPFGECDFALHITGETGSFKSELAALAQQHFGAGMTRTNLPGSWASTGNSLEMLAFHAKDTITVIDDFAPQGGIAEVSRYHATAERVFRAAGNRAGRGRLDSTARLREPKPPRCLVLSTGEEIPRGHSVRARLLILELAQGAINSAKLAESQAVAREFVLTMSGFIQWMAGRYSALKESFDRRVAELRANALRNPAHARTPDIIANLQAAFEALLEFGELCGALHADDRERLASESWRALREVAGAQARHQAATEPATQFVLLLRSCLSSGQAHLATRDGSVPKQSPRAFGWRSQGGDDMTPLGRCVGWIDDAGIYLEPAASYQIVQLAARDSGESLAVAMQTLKKRLREKGLLASTDTKRETLTVRRTICGGSKEVLHFRLETFLPQDTDLEESGDRR